MKLSFIAKAECITAECLTGIHELGVYLLSTYRKSGNSSENMGEIQTVNYTDHPILYSNVFFTNKKKMQRTQSMKMHWV